MSELLKNFHNPVIPFADTEWRDALNGEFSVHGLYRPLETGKYQRLPDELLADESINAAARALGTNTAGGRIRFATDSPYVAVVAVLPCVHASPHMSLIGSSGMDFYENGRYRMSLFPGMSSHWGRPLPVDGMPQKFDGEFTYAGGYEFPDTQNNGKPREITLYLPLYNDLKSVYIGVAPGAKILPPKAYRFSVPVVTYGSSITQGACAGRPGNCHMAVLSRMLDCDFINLGFSGSDKGETALGTWIGTLPMSLFINEYGANSPSLEHLHATHEPFHKAFRAGSPETPVIFLSMPTNPYKAAVFSGMGGKSHIVAETAANALKNGEKVRFLNGETVYGRDWDNCAADGAHPNDNGFLRIAAALAPLAEQLLGN